MLVGLGASVAVGAGETVGPTKAATVPSTLDATVASISCVVESPGDPQATTKPALNAK